MASKNFYFSSILLSLFIFFTAEDIFSQTDTSYFVQWDDNYNLLLAADKEDISSVNLLLNRGAKVNTSTVEGVTPLMYAAERGNLELVKLLIDRGADINKKPFNGATALMVASKVNHYEVAEYLVSKGAELNKRDIEGVTAVHFAAAFNNFDIMDMLIYYGADKELADDKNNTPLITAAFNNSMEAADLLIQHGAKIDTFDSNGNTPLISAIQQNNTDMALFLIQSGANINKVNDAGYSALTMAVAKSNTQVAEKLVELGANVNHKTKSGYSILEIAKLTHEDVLVDLLESNEAKRNMNPHFNTFTFGPYFDFNFTDYMNGFRLSLLDKKYGIGINGGFGFRPLANRILVKESDLVTYQYWERRYYFNAGIDKRFNLVKNINVTSGPFIGLNEFYTFGGYRGSSIHPEKKFILSPQIGWYYLNNNIKTWISYQYIDYKTPEIKPGRIDLGISLNFNFGTGLFKPKRILWLE